MTPASSGLKTATLQINSTDSDENPFDINLTGQSYSATSDTDGDGDVEADPVAAAEQRLSRAEESLADAEVVFEADAGPFKGLKLVGFAVWERRGGGRNVTFPARVYSVNGERRSFALLRPSNGELNAQDAVRDLILAAYSANEAQA